MTMTDHEFKNGITIHIPDDISKAEVIERWTEVKMWMSLILDPPRPIESVVKKPRTYTHTKRWWNKKPKEKVKK